MNEFIKQTIELTQGNLWLVQILVVLVITLIASRIRHIVLKRVESRLTSTKLIWSRTTVEAIRKPAAALIWIAGVSFSIDIFRVEYQTAILDAVPVVRNVAVIATMTWFLVRFIGIYEHRYVETKSESDQPVDLSTIQISSKILRVMAVVLGILVAMQTIGLNIAGILAFGGVGGIAIGFAAREMIANYFGALMIFLDQPFKVGETVTSSDRDIEGTVKEIGWLQTEIERFDTRTLYVPNAVFASIAVRNLTRQTNRRIYEYVGIRYDDAEQLTAVIADIKEMISNHPDIDQENLIMVNFDRFASSSLDFFIYCFTKTTVWAEYHEVKQDVLVKSMEIVARHGAQIAFPTSTIHLMSDTDVDRHLEGVISND